MNAQLFISNLTNPTLLFFVMGIVAVVIKSDLEIPAQTIKFISLYLLFAIGFKGGQELNHSDLSGEIIATLGFGLAVAFLIPVSTFFLLKARVGVANAGAIAAAYGSVSAVTFVAAANFLDFSQIPFGGHMVAVMALMEAPAIIVGITLINRFRESRPQDGNGLRGILTHSITNGSVVMVLGSLFIGLIADSKQAEGIRPFTTDIFKGFLSIFLLEMGMVTARRIGGCVRYGLQTTLFALLFPLLHGAAVALLSTLVTADVGNRFMLAVLAASASYIAVPASMRLAVPDADPGLYIPMALGITFPVNITIGMPIYLAIIQS